VKTKYLAGEHAQLNDSLPVARDPENDPVEDDKFAILVGLTTGETFDRMIVSSYYWVEEVVVQAQPNRMVASTKVLQPACGDDL
jgi:hypothetical protein